MQRQIDGGEGDAGWEQLEVGSVSLCDSLWLLVMRLQAMSDGGALVLLGA